MREDELAELVGIGEGSSSLVWQHLFRPLATLLVCSHGRWNFFHGLVKDVVRERYCNNAYVRWVLASTQLSYFKAVAARAAPMVAKDGLTAKGAAAAATACEIAAANAGTTVEVARAAAARADEELRGLERFPPETFNSYLAVRPASEAEVKMLGWALAYNRTIATLDLGGCKMGDRGAGMLADGLQKNNTLLKCDLSNNAITGYGIGMPLCSISCPIKCR